MDHSLLSSCFLWGIPSVLSWKEVGSCVLRSSSVFVMGKPLQREWEWGEKLFKKKDEISRLERDIQRPSMASLLLLSRLSVYCCVATATSKKEMSFCLFSPMSFLFLCQLLSELPGSTVWSVNTGCFSSLHGRELVYNPNAWNHVVCVSCLWSCVFILLSMTQTASGMRHQADSIVNLNLEVRSTAEEMSKQHPENNNRTLSARFLVDCLEKLGEYYRRGSLSCREWTVPTVIPSSLKSSSSSCFILCPKDCIRWRETVTLAFVCYLILVSQSSLPFASFLSSVCRSLRDAVMSS